MLTPDEQRNLVERHASLREDLRELHAGRTVPGDGDPAAQEQELARGLQSIENEFVVHQFHEERDTRESAVRMTELALRFPSITEATPGISPWDPDKLNAYAQSGSPGHGAKCAAEFLLFVWNPYDDTQWAGCFNLAEALKTWDVFHRYAFLRWAEDPFWP